MTLPPIPPSDSLYKFTAISGLILIVLSMYAYTKMNIDLTISIIDNTSQQKKLTIELLRIQDAGKKLLEEDRRIDADLQKIQEAINLESVEEDTTDRFKMTLERIKENNRKKEDLKTAHEDSEIVHTQMAGEVEKLLFLNSMTDRLSNITRILFLTGLVLAFYGFSKWYYRFQIYQDQIVKAQAEQWTKPKPETTNRDEIPG